MVWYTRTIGTVDIGNADTTETDRMWRQIDPAMYYRTVQVLDQLIDDPD